jgi:serine/threonine protein kinase
MAIAKTLYEHDMPTITAKLRSVEATTHRMPAVLDYTSQNPKDRRARWTLERDISGGSFGLVSVMRESSSKKVFACKTMIFQVNPSARSETARRLKHEKVVRNEVEIMQKLRQHCHIATIYFYARDYPRGDDREAPCLRIFMLPIADRNLDEYLTLAEAHSYPTSDTLALLKWTGCLMNALSFAHNSGVRHKDIKPANILVKRSQIYLTDFGLAVDFQEADVSYTTNSFHGTKKYRAPESVEGDYHGRKADVFSMGCVFSEMLTVILEKSRADFKEARCWDREDKAFCRNLRDVKYWLDHLRRSCKNEDTGFLLDITNNMLNEKQEDRRDASSILKLLEQRKGLECNCDGEVF